MKRLMMTIAALALLMTTTAHAAENGPVVVTGHLTIGCEILQKDVLQKTHRTEWVGGVLRSLADGDTGRIFDPENRDHCRGIPNGTVVVEKDAWGVAVCVIPTGEPPPCLWVSVYKLTYPPGYNPPRPDGSGATAAQ
jgi:hypothetical protein